MLLSQRCKGRKKVPAMDTDKQVACKTLKQVAPQSYVTTSQNKYYYLPPVKTIGMNMDRVPGYF